MSRIDKNKVFRLSFGASLSAFLWPILWALMRPNQTPALQAALILGGVLAMIGAVLMTTEAVWRCWPKEERDHSLPVTW